ncbi:MAG: GNAT family N-acetyltransferase [Halodesulfovibrio sp.]
MPPTHNTDEIFLQTDRLILRKMTHMDFDELASILQDPDVMYAWEYTFSDEEVREWINKCIHLYTTKKLGYFLVSDKATHEVLGQAALLPATINDAEYHEIGYIFKKKHWHKGYASESAQALRDHAFNNLHLDSVIFEIRPENTASCKVAESLGAKLTDSFVKVVKSKPMLHQIYTLTK